MSIVYARLPIHDVYLYKCVKISSVKGGLNMLNMNGWDKQQAARWAKANKNKLDAR